MRRSQNMRTCVKEVLWLKKKMDLMPLLLLKSTYIINIMVRGFLAMNETLMFKLLTTVLLPTFFFSQPQTC